MAISSNPTKTRTFEQNWMREINRRWRAFTTSVVGELRRMNESSTSGITINRNDPFVLSGSQQRVYIAFLESEIQRLLIVTEEAPNWQADHQILAYQRGIESTRASLISQGSGIEPTAIEVIRAQGLEVFSATPSIGTVGTNQIHRDALEFLFQRSYTSLKKWTDSMASETRQILFTAIEQGQGIDEVVREMVKRINVSKSRAQTIARTEINQAFSRAAIGEARRSSIELEEEILLRWLTIRDTRVRHSHASVHGIVMTTERASRIKTTDGVNCRCGLAPVIPEADTKAKRDKFAKERKTLLASERTNKPK